MEKINGSVETEEKAPNSVNFLFVTLVITVQTSHHNGEQVLSFVCPFALALDPSVAASAPSHLTSDSDSEVYCDSVDQFGQEEASKNLNITEISAGFSQLDCFLLILLFFLKNSEHNRSLDDLDEEENHLQPPLEERRETQEDVQGPLQVVRCGGEDGEAGGAMSQRLNVTVPGGSSVRRGRGKAAFTGFYTHI